MHKNQLDLYNRTGTMLVLTQVYLASFFSNVKKRFYLKE